MFLIVLLFALRTHVPFGGDDFKSLKRVSRVSYQVK